MLSDKELQIRVHMDMESMGAKGEIVSKAESRMSTWTSWVCDTGAHQQYIVIIPSFSALVPLVERQEVHLPNLNTAPVAVWYSAGFAIGRLWVRISAWATSHQGLLSLPSLRRR